MANVERIRVEEVRTLHGVVDIVHTWECQIVVDLSFVWLISVVNR